MLGECLVKEHSCIIFLKANRLIGIAKGEKVFEHIVGKLLQSQGRAFGCVYVAKHDLILLPLTHHFYVSHKYGKRCSDVVGNGGNKLGVSRPCFLLILNMTEHGLSHVLNVVGKACKLILTLADDSVIHIQLGYDSNVGGKALNAVNKQSDVSYKNQNEGKTCRRKAYGTEDRKVKVFAILRKSHDNLTVG